MIPTNLETLYDILTVWFSRFEGTDGVTISFNNLGMKITVYWVYPDSDKLCTAQYSITKEEMEQGVNFDDMEEHIMNEIERQHMVWEVGEE